MAFVDAALVFFPVGSFNGRRLWDRSRLLWAAVAAPAFLSLLPRDEAVVAAFRTAIQAPEQLPAGTDPDTFVRRQGAGAYRDRLTSSQSYLEFLLDRASAGRDLNRRRAGTVTGPTRPGSAPSDPSPGEVRPTPAV